MKLWECYCRDARMVGAIGIFYPIRSYIRADTKEEAEQFFRRLHETRFGPVVVTEHTQDPIVN